MAQVKIYGLKQSLQSKRTALSDAVHQALMEAFGLAQQKKFQRFFYLEKEDFIFPADRSDHYTIIEISVFQGRSDAAKKQLIKLLFSYIKQQTAITEQDLEITIFETPQANWGIRGKPGDELVLDYKVNI